MTRARNWTASSTRWCDELAASLGCPHGDLSGHQGVVQGLAASRARGRTDHTKICSQPTSDLVGARGADPLDQRLGLGLLGLGQQDMEPIRGSAGDAIRLTGMEPHDLPDACGDPVGAPRWREPKSDHDDARRSTVAGHPRVFVAESDVPVGTGIERDRSEPRRSKPGWSRRLADPSSGLGRRPIEECLDDVTDAVVMLVVG